MQAPKTISTTRVRLVNCQLSQNSQPSASAAVTKLAGEMDQAGAHQVADPLGVGHDPARSGCRSAWSRSSGSGAA